MPRRSNFATIVAELRKNERNAKGKLVFILLLPLLAISFIFVTKLLKLVSSSSTSEAASRLPRWYCALLI